MTRRAWAHIVAIGVLAAAGNALWIHRDLRPPGWDAAWYLIEAHRAAERGALGTLAPLAQTRSYAPLLVSSLAVSKRSFGLAHTDRHVAWVQGLAILAAALGAGTAAGAIGGDGAARRGALMAILTPGFFAAAHHASADTLLAAGTALLAGGLAFLSSNAPGARGSRGARAMIFAGAAVAVLSKLAGGIFLAALFVPWTWIERKRPCVLRAGWIACALGVATAAPLWAGGARHAADYLHDVTYGWESGFWSRGGPWSGAALSALAEDAAANQIPPWFAAPLLALVVAAARSHGDRPAIRVLFAGAAIPVAALLSTRTQQARVLLPCFLLFCAIAGVSAARYCSGLRGLVAGVALLGASAALHFGLASPHGPIFEAIGIAPVSLRATRAGWAPHLLDRPDRRDWGLREMSAPLGPATYIAANHPVYNPTAVAYARALCGASFAPAPLPRAGQAAEWNGIDEVLLLLPPSWTLPAWRGAVEEAARVTESDSAWTLRARRALPGGGEARRYRRLPTP